MELEFYGASGGVTGSCYILRVGGRQLLLDCGLFQGRRKEQEANRDPFPFRPSEIDAVVLSHGHIDHSGRLPLLVKGGFTGPIYTQNATRDLCRVLLLDSAGLAVRDVKYENRRRARKGLKPIEPLYTQQDANEALSEMVGLRYGEKKEILPGLAIRLADAGHIIGSAIVELWLTEAGVTRKLVYSGDLGQNDTPILYDPTLIEQADVVLMESTYGNHLHRDRALTVVEIGEVIQRARHDRGNVLIPAFAVGRSQEILYLLGKHYEAWGLDRWQIFLDSPMAIEASRVYWDYPHLYDEDATKLRKELNEMPRLHNLHLTQQTEESKRINRLKSGAIIIAGSGMCNGGRIVHHLKNNIWRRECHVLIVGYQAYGTLGRRLVNGEKTVRIHGQTYNTKAKIHTVGGLSAHADQAELLSWAQGFKTGPTVFVMHGESDAKREFAGLLQQKVQLKAHIPKPGDVVDLTRV